MHSGGRNTGAAEQARARRARAVERSVLGALSAVVVIVVLGNDWGVLSVDTKPEVFLAPWRTLHRTLASWQDAPFLGSANFNVGMAPVTLVTGLLEALGMPPWLVARVWRLALLLLAGAGARRFYADLTEGTTAATATARVATAVAFVANPYILLGGATTPTLLPYALLPWFLTSLRRGFATPRGWAAPARAALWMAAMGGMNAGVVPFLQLLAVPALLVHAHRCEGRTWRALLSVSVRTLVLTAALSAYWLVPALAAVGLGSAIAGTTEPLSAIGAASSYAEVLRGLGFWPLYGGDAAGPFMPGLVAYVTSPVVIVASFALPLAAAVGALVSRSRVRVLGAGLLVASVPVMVGFFPPDSPSPLGRLLTLSVEHVPGAVALRTTNKAGAVLELGLALLVGLGAAELPRRLPARNSRVAAAAVAAVVVTASVAPAFTGGLFTLRVPLPGYWRDAASALDDTHDGTRVLFVPGITLARYRWGYQVPDDLGNALLSRDTVVRTTVPNGTTYAANLLAGTDLRLQEGDLPPGALSALARYIGAGDVLVRNDVVWELSDGARPAVVAGAAAQDPGLRPVAAFGAVGQFTTSGGAAPASVADQATAADAALPPLQRYAVADARPPTRQVGAGGALLVDGDGEALPDLAAAGLLAGDPALLTAGAMDPASLRQALLDGAEVVLTDTNARREWNPQKLAGGTGALQPATAPVEPTRALFTPDDQTVAVDAGTAAAGAQGRGMLFGPVPGGDPSLAFDGDRTTAWLTGNFGTGAGNTLTVHAARVVAMPQVRLWLPAGAGQRITRVRVHVSGGGNDVDREVQLSPLPAQPTVVSLGDARGDTVAIEILATDGTGYGAVGLAEVDVPGFSVVKVARLPVRLVHALGGLDPTARAVLSGTPVDVLLHRRLGSPSDVGDDEEPRLARDFSLPDARVLWLSGHLRLAAGAADEAVDALLGAGATVQATSSSRAFANPDLRASRALDVTATGTPDLSTGWAPAEPVVGEWVQVRFPRHVIDHLNVTQSGTGGAGSALTTRAGVSIDGGAERQVDLGPGTTRIPLPATAASSVRLTLRNRVGTGPVVVSDLALPGVAPFTPPATPPAAAPCLDAGMLDGRPIAVRPLGSVQDLAAGSPLPFVGCSGSPLDLSAGRHWLRPVGAWAIDDLLLRDARSRAGTATTTRPADTASATVESTSPTRVTVRTRATHRPYLVVAGKGFDAGWTASADGADLGRPLLVDGYSAGWRIGDGLAHTVVIRYTPALRGTVAAALSMIFLLGCAVLAIWPGLRVSGRIASSEPRRGHRWVEGP